MKRKYNFHSPKIDEKEEKMELIRSKGRLQHSLNCLQEKYEQLQKKKKKFNELDEIYENKIREIKINCLEIIKRKEEEFQRILKQKENEYVYFPKNLFEENKFSKPSTDFFHFCQFFFYLIQIVIPMYVHTHKPSQSLGASPYASFRATYMVCINGLQIFDRVSLTKCI